MSRIEMGKMHPMGLRQRLVALDEESNAHREAARHFRVIAEVRQRHCAAVRKTGALAPKPQGSPGAE